MHTATSPSSGLTSPSSFGDVCLDVCVAMGGQAMSISVHSMANTDRARLRSLHAPPQNGRQQQQQPNIKIVFVQFVIAVKERMRITDKQ